MLERGRAEATDYARSHPALTDAQSGLANRLHFDLVYDYLFEAGNRGLPFTVLLVSVGGGEPVAPDEVRRLGQAIASTTRNSDLVSHVGNGRYVVLMLGTNLQGARIAADRLEAALVGAPGPLAFGMAAYSDECENSEELLRAADTALLAAEAAGGGVEFG